MKKQDLQQVSYCGLSCRDCFAHKGLLANLARDLRKELRQTRFEKLAEAICDIPMFKTFQHYYECYEVLGAMVKFRCKRGCRGGGGAPCCKIRDCARRKNIEGCWLCEKYSDCEKLDFLNAGHGDAHRKNLQILKRKGVTEFLAGKPHWYSKPKETKTTNSKTQKK